MPSKPTPAVESAPDFEPIVVRAIAIGTYPEPGAIRARMRQPGDVFTISCMEHFAGPNAGVFQWMELASTPPAPEPAQIPPTTVENQVVEPMSTIPGAPVGGVSQPRPRVPKSVKDF